MKVTVGVDQSFTLTGLYLNSNDGKIVWEKIKTDANSDDPLDKFRRATLIADGLIAFITSNKATRVVIEGLAMGNIKGNSNRDLAGLQAVLITRILSEFGDSVEVVIASPTTIKKLATGKGNAKKPEMVEALPTEVHESFVAGNLRKTTGLYDLAKLQM